MLDVITTIAGGVRRRQRRVIGGAADPVVVTPGAPPVTEPATWKSLLPYINQDHWYVDGPPAYFVHLGRVHMRGRMFWEGSNLGPRFADVIMVLPPELHPPAPVTIMVPTDFANMSATGPRAWPTVVEPDGTWHFVEYVWPGDPDLLPHFPDRLAWDDNGDGILLAGASWVIQAKADTPTYVDLTPYLNTAYWAPVTAVEGAAHGNMAHFRGRIQATRSMGGEFASRIFTSLPFPLPEFFADFGGYAPIYAADGTIFQGELDARWGFLIDLEGDPVATYEWADTAPIPLVVRGYPSTVALTRAGTDGKSYVLPQPNLTAAADPPPAPLSFGQYRRVELGLHWLPAGAGTKSCHWCIGDPAPKFVGDPAPFYRVTATIYYPGNGIKFDLYGGLAYKIERVQGGVATLLGTEFADGFWNGAITSRFQQLPPLEPLNTRILVDYDDYWVNPTGAPDPAPGTPKVSFWFIVGGGARASRWEARPPGVSTHGPVGFVHGDSGLRPSHLRATDHPIRSGQQFYPVPGQQIDLDSMFLLLPSAADPVLGTVIADVAGGGIVPS